MDGPGLVIRVGRRHSRRDAPRAHSEERALDWLTTEAGWVVPAVNVLGLPTTGPRGLSRKTPVDSFRDLSAPSCVGMAMVAVLRPRSRRWDRSPWWAGILAMAGLDDVELTAPPPRPSSAAATTKDGRPPRTGERPDADLLNLDPADQLAALTRRHADAVYRVALSVTRNPDLAEDVAQDALLKAWQALPSYRGDAPLKNWLLRITHNTAISALRRRRDVHLDPSEFPEDAPSAHLAPPVSVEASVEDRASFTAFEAALEQLDELSRSVVVLREVEGMSYDEIATVLDVPLPTVKTRLLRARRLLSTALEGWRP